MGIKIGFVSDRKCWKYSKDSGFEIFEKGQNWKKWKVADVHIEYFTNQFFKRIERGGVESTPSGPYSTEKSVLPWKGQVYFVKYASSTLEKTNL